MLPRKRGRPKGMIPNYIPKIVKSEPSLNKRYGHLTEYRYNDNGTLIMVLADDKGNVCYRSHRSEFTTLEELDAAYGKGKRYEG